VPQDLDKPHRLGEPSPAAPLEDEQPLQSSTGDGTDLSSSVAVDDAGKPSVAQPPAKTKPPGPLAYVLASKELLTSFQEKDTPLYGAQRKLMRQTGGGRYNEALNQATWRSDMSSFVLELLRRRTVDNLLFFAEFVEKQDRKYLIRLDRWDDVSKYNHRGCLLVLGGGKPQGSAKSGAGIGDMDHKSMEGSTAINLPARLSTMTLEGKRFGGKLAVHDLEALLGEEHTSRLRQESTLLSEGNLFLLGRRKTERLQLLIWKLQGYMA